MTKKHFEAIATALAASRPQSGWDPNKRVQWDLDVRNITIVLKRINPRFNNERFVDACETRPNQVDA
jgi:hypothetical protein